MKRYNEKRQRKKDAEYLNKIKQQYITEIKGSYSKELSELFFRHGNYKWVKKVRSLFIEDARMIGIATQAIVEYFKENNGLIDYRTVQGYTNNY
jgi:isocitrate dehydrogenase kinase/phosphatase